jgi:hypothetical protein
MGMKKRERRMGADIPAGIASAEKLDWLKKTSPDKEFHADFAAESQVGPYKHTF